MPSVTGPCGDINIRNFGAVGDGVTDDTQAIQKCIDYAKTQGSGDPNDLFPRADFGAMVRIPPGKYMISKPLILPRSDYRGGYSVHLVGDNMISSIIQGSDNFPPNRALIEWERTPIRIFYQRIANLTLNCPNVDGTMCIWHKPLVTDDLYGKTFNEYLSNSIFENLVLGGSNQYQKYLFKMDGLLRFSRLDNIISNLGRGNKINYSTIVIYAESNLQGTNIYDEQIGVTASTITRILSGGLRGGYGGVLAGRFHECTIDNIVSGNGNYGPVPSFNFINSASCTVNNVGSEGIEEMPQLRLENCKLMTFDMLNIGSPETNGKGDGIYLINCEDCTFTTKKNNLGSGSNFTTRGSKLIRIDAQSKRNRFFNIQVAGPNEVDIQAPSQNYNYVQAYDNMSNVVRTYGKDIFAK